MPGMKTNSLIFLINIFVLLTLLSSCDKTPEMFDPCENISCANEGTCVNGICECPDGFSGANCEIEDLCFTQAINCLNGGDCIDGACDCPSGFTGTNCELIVDVDGNSYETIKIGNQEWMTTNLRTTKCNDGTEIPFISDQTQWEGLTTPAYCWYENDSNLGFGPLYNGFTVDACNVCPIGWHVPTEEEWMILIDFLGGPEIAGGKLKATGLENWDGPNAGATNESGFSGLPGGDRGYGGFFSFKEAGAWWSSDSDIIDAAMTAQLLTFHTTVNTNLFSKKKGVSIRCLKD